MHRSKGLKFAVLGVVGSYNQDGVHGYALKRQCDRILGHFWQLNFPEVYRILEKLKSQHWVEATRAESANRKIYRITNKGQECLDSFLLTPPTDLPRPLRQELAVKLLFARREQLAELLRMIRTQRDTYMEQLHLLSAQRRKLKQLPVDPFVVNLLIDGAERSFRAEIAWLDDVCQKLTARFGTPAT